MEDKITLTTVSGKNTQELKITGTTPFKNGGNESKSIVEAKIGNHSISLIERQDNTQRYIRNWKIFKDADMPVVPTCRESSQGTVYVTNIKADGSDIFGKGRWFEEYNHSVNKAEHHLDNYFLELTEPSQIDEIKKEVGRLVEKANDNQLILPFDDAFELIIHPDKSWQLMTLDLTNADKASDFGRGIARAKSMNQNATNRFMDDLQNLRNLLQNGNSE